MTDNGRSTNTGLQGLRVAHLSSVHSWSDNRIHFREAASLQAAGADVVVVANAPQFPAKAIAAVHALRLRRRALRMLISSAEAVAYAIRRRVDVAHLHDPELVPFIPVLKAFGIKVVYDAHEDLLEQIGNKPYLPRRTKHLAQTLARPLIRLAGTADLIVTATKKVAERFPPAKTVVVHNYPLLSPSAPVIPDIDEREFAVVYVGALSEARGAITMLDALEHRAFPQGWRLLLAGGGHPELLARMKSHPGWGAVDFLGEVAPTEARTLMERARIGLAVLHDNPAYREALPTKMFEYFASGMPAIVSDFSLWRDIVERWDCGVVVAPDSPEALADAIARYVSEPDLLKRHAENAARAAKSEFNWAPEAAHLVTAYRALRTPSARLVVEPSFVSETPTS
ncbi:glycosyltransferase [Agrococcus sp. DT81.2]|uniref:glycosyltransferase n=1 Tax=Agrococcus sp. DT81.2 TaxID=3393414 RepID=UPI003CE51F10